MFEGVKQIDIKHTADVRGGFVKILEESVLSNLGQKFEIREMFYSISQKDVLRGMHFQEPPYESAKLVHVLSGAVLDVLVDLRRDSSTYKKCMSVPLSHVKPQLLYIPAGIAHGFKAVQDNTCMMYMVDREYVPGADTGVRYDTIGFDWDIREPVLSERDKGFVSLEEYNSLF